MRRRGRPRRRSVDRGTCRPGIEPRNQRPGARASGSPGCRRRGARRKATPEAPPPRGASGPRAVRDPEHARKHLAREPGDPAFVRGGGSRGPHREVQGRTPMMDGRGKSDSPVVPGKPPNKAEGLAAEAAEGRGLAKGNPPERDALRTQGRGGAPSALERVRQAASSALALSPKAGAGCGNAARPDLWRGWPAMVIPTPTLRTHYASSRRLASGPAARRLARSGDSCSGAHS